MQTQNTIAMAFKDYTGGSQNGNNNGGGSNGPGNPGAQIPKGGLYWGAPNNPNNTGVNPEELDLVNYNKKFKNAPPAMFREQAIQQVTGTLISFLKPNCILTGPAGCGKTRIVEDIARMLANNDPSIPKHINGCTIYELPLGTLMAGTSFRGQLEQKICDILEFAENKKNKAILFIDEIHMLLGRDESYRQVAQILKPALGRGTIRLIGATTTQEANHLMKDPAFNRRFSTVIVNELEPGQAAQILETLREKLSAHYGVTVQPEMCQETVRIADHEKKAWQHRPDNAIHLFDKAISDTLLERIKQEQSASQVMRAFFQSNPPVLTPSQIQVTARNLLTGKASQPEYSREILEGTLAKIQGQDKAMKQLIDCTLRASLGLYPPKKPQAWLFAGPSGTGKTETAKLLAEKFTGSKPIILNMTEFHDKESINRIIGAPAGYAGYDSDQELPFDILDTNPFQVILLDEFEKCDKGVQRLFMSVLEEGTMTTSKNRTIDFSRAIVIATTNAGVSQSKPLGFGAKESQPTTAALAKSFDPELLNRIGDSHVLFFQPINKDTYKTICQEAYTRIVSEIRGSRPSIPLPDAIPEDGLSRIVEDTYNPLFNARPAENSVKTWVEDFVMNWQAAP